VVVVVAAAVEVRADVVVGRGVAVGGETESLALATSATVLRASFRGSSSSSDVPCASGKARFEGRLPDRSVGTSCTAIKLPWSRGFSSISLIDDLAASSSVSEPAAK